MINKYQRKCKATKILKYAGIASAASVATMAIVAVKKLPDSRYANNPNQKNPFQGKKVEFIYDKNGSINADGVCGHLKSTGNLDFVESFYDKYVKRALDILVSASGLIILSPVFAGISIAIQIDDPGTILFCQKRVGKNKEYFKLHKFRSMKMSTPKNIPTHMMKNPEEYITKVGKFLRKHSLDELPQIWDIFIGNMSFVGPRPGLWNQDLLTAERDKYDVSKVKPGLTGWAQINGRDELKIPIKAKYDGEYVANQSFKMDAMCFAGSASKIANDDAVVEGGTGSKNNVINNAITETTEFLGDDFLQDVSKKYLIGNIGFDREIHVDKTLRRKVLITGKTSYIGNSFKEYALKHYSDNFEIDTISVRGESWKDLDFSNYDIILHVAGIAHRKPTKDSIFEDRLYYEVNTLLPYKIALKAKNDGVKYFFFLSSLSVYGESDNLEEDILITEGTIPKPVSFYGKSKILAEVKLRELESDTFKIVCLRPPMVYGLNCKGNFPKLVKYVKISPFLPVVNNMRSMIYIDNLSEMFSQIMTSDIPNSCVLLPQNKDYICTTDLLKLVAKMNKKQLVLIPFNFVLKTLSITNTTISRYTNKAFGTFIVDKNISKIPDISYQIVKTNESFVRSLKEYY